jgi:hypothetical protein
VRQNAELEAQACAAREEEGGSDQGQTREKTRGGQRAQAVQARPAGKAGAQGCACASQKARKGRLEAGRKEAGGHRKTGRAQACCEASAGKTGQGSRSRHIQQERKRTDKGSNGFSSIKFSGYVIP